MKLTKSQIDWEIHFLKRCIDTDSMFPEIEILEERMCFVIHDFVINFFRKNGFVVDVSGSNVKGDGHTVIYWNKSQSTKLKSLLCELEALKDFQ